MRENLPPVRHAARSLQCKVVSTLMAPAGVAGFQTLPQPVIHLGFDGIAGDKHAGFTRKADARTPWYRRGEPIANIRHVSVVSLEELADIAAAMGVAAIEPEWLGANVVLEGLPYLSWLPRGTRMAFSSGSVIAAQGYNPPCSATGKAVEAQIRQLPQAFVKAARHLRGIVASVERAGEVRAGDTVEMSVAEQWIYA